jgi:hypothetical protein
MDSARFVGKFPEIAHLSKAEQEVLLERAHVETFERLGLGGEIILYIISCPLLGFTIAMLPAFLFTSSPLAWLVCFCSGIILANLAYQRLYQHLLARGLQSLLKHPKTAGVHH